jgi:hypothetical protein
LSYKGTAFRAKASFLSLKKSDDFDFAGYASVGVLVFPPTFGLLWRGIGRVCGEDGKKLEEGEGKQGNFQ